MTQSLSDSALNDAPLYIESQPNLVKLRNVLMTYAVVDFDIGYVQGMNDLAAPLVETINDEATAFQAFQGFMKRMVNIH